jgi:hypothetical protein
MIVDIGGVEAQLSQLASQGAWEQLLHTTLILGNQFMHNPALKGMALYEPKSDGYLRLLGSMLIKPRPVGVNKKAVVHVATEVYPIGGHTRVLEDIVSALPDMRHTLILTDITRRYEKGTLALANLAERFEKIGLNVLYLRQPTWLGRTRELVSLIEAIAPQAIFLNAHHYDCVAYAGISGESAPRVNFLHHADHQPSFGATRTDYEHIDLTPPCHKVCSQVPALRAKMLHMTVADRGVAQIDWTRPLTGATCGNHVKYQGCVGFSYAELLAELFHNRVERIYHIGALPADQLAEIQGKLVQLGADPSRLEHVGETPSLAQKLIELAPQFYLSSHPVGGGKAVLEAMSVGLPLVLPNTAEQSPLLSGMDVEEGLVVSRLGDVAPAIATIIDNGPAIAKACRDRYVAFHSPQSFQHALREAVE